MKLNIEKEMAALRRMTIGELRGKYAEVFGEPTASFHREYLIRKILWRRQAIEEGDLSDRARQRVLEIANDADLRLRSPSLRLVGTADGPVVTAALDVRPQPNLPMPGAVITRTYRGRQISVRVLDKGFEYEGERYRSLTAVAKVITGAHWNGNLFFGIKPVTKRKAGQP